MTHPEHESGVLASRLSAQTIVGVKAERALRGVAVGERRLLANDHASDRDGGFALARIMVKKMPM